MSRSPKRPRDPAQLAKFIVDVATGEVEDSKSQKTPLTKKAAATLGGAKRAIALSKDRRTEIASKAAKKRWAAKSSAE